MNTLERLNNWKLHDSIRGHFGKSLYEAMVVNPDIFLVMGDLGFGLFDAHREDFPDRCINVGAAEQVMVGAAVGLALEQKTVLCYTITSFYLRAAETIGLYLDGEQIPVKLIGSGRGDDYKHDGPSHECTRAQRYLNSLDIANYYPNKKERIPNTLKHMLENGKPSFISLRR